MSNVEVLLPSPVNLPPMGGGARGGGHAPPLVNRRRLADSESDSPQPKKFKRSRRRRKKKSLLHGRSRCQGRSRSRFKGVLLRVGKPFAPFNSNQYLMEEYATISHNPLEEIRKSSTPCRRGLRWQEFCRQHSCTQDTSSYEGYQHLDHMSKAELVEKYLHLEDELSELTARLEQISRSEQNMVMTMDTSGELLPPGEVLLTTETAAKISVFKEEIRTLELENKCLREDNARRQVQRIPGSSSSSSSSSWSSSSSSDEDTGDTTASPRDTTPEEHHQISLQQSGNVSNCIATSDTAIITTTCDTISITSTAPSSPTVNTAVPSCGNSEAATSGTTAIIFASTSSGQHTNSEHINTERTINEYIDREHTNSERTNSEHTTSERRDNTYSEHIDSTNSEHIISEPTSEHNSEYLNSEHTPSEHTSEPPCSAPPLISPASVVDGTTGTVPAVDGTTGSEQSYDTLDSGLDNNEPPSDDEEN